MGYIDERNIFIKQVNDPELKKPKDYFTPDDVAQFVALAIKKYVSKIENLSLLDPMAGSGNLVYQVVEKIGKDKFSKIVLNRYNQKANDANLYKELRKELKKYTDKVNFSEKDINSFNTKADIVVVNLDGNFLGKHKSIHKLTNKTCFILDTNLPNQVEYDSSKFSLQTVINLGEVGIGGKRYYLYVYKKEK